LLLDPEIDRATKLATPLEMIGFPTRTESTGAAALAAIKGHYYATLIVAATSMTRRVLAGLMMICGARRRASG
jgi:hypothetical protein